MKVTSIVTGPGATRSAGRCVRMASPWTATPAAIGSVVTVPIADSSTSNCSPTSRTSLGSRRPRAIVDTVPVARSMRRTAPLYVSATASEPSGSAQMPSGCCRRACVVGPSTCPKSNRPVPTTVSTRSPLIRRMADVSASTTYTTWSIATRPDGCANHASARVPSVRPSWVVPAKASTCCERRSKRQMRCSPAMAIRICSSSSATSQGVESRVCVAEPLAGSDCIHCSPVPASVVTVRSSRRRPRTR